MENETLNLTEGMKNLALTEFENELCALIDDCSNFNPYTEEHKNLTRLCQIEKYLPEFAEVLKVAAFDNCRSLNSVVIREWHKHASYKVRNGMIK